MLGAHMVLNIVVTERADHPYTLVVALRLEPTFSSQPNAIQKQHCRPITFEVLGSREVTISPYL